MGTQQLYGLLYPDGPLGRRNPWCVCALCGRRFELPMKLFRALYCNRDSAVMCVGCLFRVNMEIPSDVHR